MAEEQDTSYSVLSSAGASESSEAAGKASADAAGRTDAEPAVRGSGSLDPSSLEFAAWFNAGTPRPPAEIWEKVVNQKERLPGTWDATASGALDAARAGDVPLCAYLAACCFAQGGASALAARDEKCTRTFWLEIASPVVVHVPLGQERLCVAFEDQEEREWVPTDQVGTAVSSPGQVWVRGRGAGKLAQGPQGLAERFNPGRCIELSQVQWRRQRLKRLILQDQDRIELRHALVQQDGKEARGMECLDRAVPQVNASGAWFHVLAYPLAGDVTKALLRPALSGWNPLQRQHADHGVRWLGETLVSQCAKSGQWALVETLLRAGVPCPDLSREFEDICGGSPQVRSRWRRDLLGAAGYARGLPTLLELAAWGAGAERATSQASPQLAKVLAALVDEMPCEGLDLVAVAGGRRPPLVQVAAEGARWDVVAMLLDQPEDVVVSAASLLPPFDARLEPPAGIMELAGARARRELRRPSLPGDLREYFLRVHQGEVLVGMLPKGHSLRGGSVLAPNDAEVLHLILRLGGATAPDSDASLLFVAVSAAELAEARAAAASPSCAMLPVNLSGRAVAAEPSSGVWLAVLCPAAYSTAGGLLTVPRNSIPTPHVLQTGAVRVTTVTQCCRALVGGVPVQIAGRTVGKTDEDGSLTLELPPGRHMLSTAGQSRGGRDVVVASGGEHEAAEVELEACGELFLYLIDLSCDDDLKDGVMIGGCRDDLPDEARRFRGKACVGGRAGRLRSQKGHAVLCAPAGSQCCESLKAVSVEEGREYAPNEDFAEFLEQMGPGECLVAELLRGKPPMKVGTLKGAPEADAEADADAPADAVRVPSAPSLAALPSAPGRGAAGPAKPQYRLGRPASAVFRPPARGEAARSVATPHRQRAGSLGGSVRRPPTAGLGAAPDLHGRPFARPGAPTR